MGLINRDNGSYTRLDLNKKEAIIYSNKEDRELEKKFSYIEDIIKKRCGELEGIISTYKERPPQELLTEYSQCYDLLMFLRDANVYRPYFNPLLKKLGIDIELHPIDKITISFDSDVDNIADAYNDYKKHMVGDIMNW